MSGENSGRRRILTGDRASGKLHLGHYVGSLANRVNLQHEYDTFVLIADVQALTTNFEHPERLREDVRHIALDYLAAGIDPNIATIVVQSMVPQIAELTVYYSMLVTVNQLRHNPTIKTEAAERGYKDLTYGFLGYPVSQAADITFCKAELVPVGSDQVPHIELTRKIVRRFNELYAPVLVEPEALVGDFPRLVGLDGKAKMSKSLDNAIYISDPVEEVERRIGTAVTDPARVHPRDPGHPDVCTVFTYHKAFNTEVLNDLRETCEKGGIGCVQCKKVLCNTVNTLLGPMRERRAYYEARPKLVDEILMTGTEKAQQIGAQTIEEVRAAMKIDYFQ